MSSVVFESSCSSMPSFFRKGSVDVDRTLEELEMCTAKVSSLCIYRTPVQGMSAVSHHFLVLEMSSIVHPSEGDLKGLKIRAEKVVGRKNTGIHVEEIRFIREKNLTKRYFMEGLNVSFPMARLLMILTNHCADYDILNDNCWLYAHNTLKVLVEELRGLEPEVALNDLPPSPIMPGEVINAVLLPEPFRLSAVFRIFSRTSAS